MSKMFFYATSKLTYIVSSGGVKLYSLTYSLQWICAFWRSRI